VPRPAPLRYTYEDYLSTPEDGLRRYEIVDGELFVTAARRFRHQQIAMNVGRLLATLAIEHGLGEVVAGPVTVHLHDELVLEPDLLLIRAERLDVIGADGRVHGPPDLVVEILSPSNQAYDRNLKRKHYLENGVPEIWVVDADERTVEVWRPEAAQPEVARDVLVWRVGEHRFEIEMTEVFRG
jgi:Uma2 family endonuclease